MKILKELISLHGKGADDNRYLWPEMLRVIRETRPLWVIGENVAGITNMVQPGSETDVETKSDQDEENYKETILEQEYIINTICDDLEREGYSVQPIIVPACGVGAPHKRYRVWFIASDCSDARVEGLRQGREDKIHGFEFTSQTRDKIRRLITDTSGLRSHRFLYDKEDDKKQRSTENRFFKKYACRDWDGRGSTQWKSFPTQSPICRGNDGLPFNVDNLTIPYGKWRKESIKAYGNAIVPLIAVKIFEMINKKEKYKWIVGKYAKYNDSFITRIDDIHHIPIFSENSYTSDLKPDDFIFVNGTVVRYSVNSNCYSLAKERIQVQIKDIIDMPDGEFENLVERLFNEAKKNLL